MPDNYFQTENIPLAITLVTLGFKLEVLDRKSRKTKFYFSRTAELAEAVQAFWLRRLKVEPIALFVNQAIIESCFLCD